MAGELGLLGCPIAIRYCRGGVNMNDDLFDCECGQSFSADSESITAHCPHCGAYVFLLRGEDELTQASEG